MKKIGLIIENTKFGKGSEALSINKNNSWATFKTDARSHFEGSLKHFDGTSKTITFVKFLGVEGYLLCWVKARPEGSGRGNDNTAAWINIPADIKISGTQINQIINEVDYAFSNFLEPDYKHLEDIFKIEYPIKKSQNSIVSQLNSSSDNKFAVRYYGKGTDYTFEELLGDNIAQNEYTHYKAVIFVDKESGITTKPEFISTLKSQIKKICTIHPPLKNDKGFIPYINFAKGDKLFSKPIEISEGATFNIIWKKVGYKDVVKPYTVTIDDNNKPPSGVDLFENDYNLLIKRSIFRIIDDKNRQVDECLIFIEGKPLNQKETPFPELWFEKEVEVKVEKQGYKSYSKKINIKGQNSHIIILDNIMYNYEFKIPAYNDEGEDERLDEEAKIVITTKENLKDSPIKGYKLNKQIFLYADKVYRGDLKYDENKDKKLKRKSFMEGFIVSFITCLIIVSGIVFSREKNNYKSQFAWPPIVKVEKKKKPIDTEEKKSGKEDEVTFKYLDENNEWEKEKLNEYYEGLFDDIVKYNFMVIANKWDIELSQSSRFNQIVELAKTAQDSNFVLSKSGDEDFWIDESTIDFEKYIDWIKNKIEHKR